MNIIAKNKRAINELRVSYSRPLQQFTDALKASESKAILFSVILLSLSISASFSVVPQVYNLITAQAKPAKSKVESKVDQLVSEYFAESKDFVESKELEKAYSFQYTSLGFYLKSLEFINANSQLETEKQILNSIPKSLRGRASQYVRAVLLISEKYQVDPIWVLSVMWTESHFKSTSRSHVGAAGLMQVMPRTRKYTYRKMKRAGKSLVVENIDFNINDYFDYKISKNKYKKHVRKLVNIEIGIIYLKGLLKTFNYNHKLATVAYNMGPGWTRGRLRRNLPVGTDNRYLRKVKKAYKYMVHRI